PACRAAGQSRRDLRRPPVPPGPPPPPRPRKGAPPLLPPPPPPHPAADLPPPQDPPLRGCPRQSPRPGQPGPRPPRRLAVQGTAGITEGPPGPWQLTTALRTCSKGMYCEEAATELTIAHKAWRPRTAGTGLPARPRARRRPTR